MKFKRRSRAAWQGGVEDGGGTISLGSGAFEGGYSLRARTAHAGCFTMSLSSELTEAGYPPADLRTTATVYLERQQDGFAIPRIDLETTGDVPGIDQAAFERFAADAERNCPVSKVLAAAEITVQATLTASAR
jgi:lipoyl-dependent peroxiredoxin